MDVGSLVSMPLFETWINGDKISPSCPNSVKEALTVAPIILIGDIGEGAKRNIRGNSATQQCTQRASQRSLHHETLCKTSTVQ